jgi:hypothetical protein
MELKITGAARDYKEYYERRTELEKFKRWIVENNIQPMSRDEFLRVATEIAAENRKKKEEQDRKTGDNQTPSDNAE